MSGPTDNVTINRNIQIVEVLCQNGVGIGVTVSGLLAALQARYPTSEWTLEILNTLLALGKQQGRFYPVGSVPGGPVEGWTLNKKMLQVNYALNKIYAPYCSALAGVGCGTAGSCGPCSYR
jgi:hypothetical protein